MNGDKYIDLNASDFEWELIMGDAYGSTPGNLVCGEIYTYM